MRHRKPNAISYCQIRGFTLIELMMVAAIIGLLAAIALPKFGNLIIASKEAAVKGKLGSFRSALSIYYADTEGYYPVNQLRLPLALTAGGKYIDEIPVISIPTILSHTPNNLVRNLVPGIEWVYMVMQINAWAYDVTPMNETYQITVNCTHTDSHGRIWSTF